jgi:hypothetical protein
MMTEDNLHSPSSVDEDAVYFDFIDSISVSAEELSVLITMPEIQSVEQARRYVLSHVPKVQIEPLKAPDGWFAREMEKMTAYACQRARQLATAISLGLIELRQGRDHGSSK